MELAFPVAAVIMAEEEAEEAEEALAMRLLFTKM
jgi:hypothetical protein